MKNAIYFVSIVLMMNSSSAWAGVPVSLVVDINRDVMVQAKPLQCVFDKLDETLRIVKMPWKRGQIATEYNKVDGFFIASQSPKRDEYAVFSRPVATIEWVFVVTAENKLTPDHPDFYAQKFTSTRGARRVGWLQEQLDVNENAQEIDLLSSTFRTMNALYQGEVDVVLSNRESYKQTIAALPISDNEFKVYTVREVDGGVYFGKAFLAKNQGFLDRFNQAAEDCHS